MTFMQRSSMLLAKFLRSWPSCFNHSSVMARLSCSRGLKLDRLAILFVNPPNQDAQRFSIGLKSGLTAGQSKTRTLWSQTTVLYHWLGDLVRCPAEKSIRDLQYPRHKEANTLLINPGTCIYPTFLPKTRSRVSRWPQNLPTSSPNQHLVDVLKEIIFHREDHGNKNVFH